jgi:hypothetical protein
LLVLACAAARAAEPAPKAFGWFADFAETCWVGDFPDGKTRHKHCYTSQFGKLMRGTAVLSVQSDGKWEERFYGDSVYAWKEKDARIDYVIWGSDGSLARLEAFYEGESLVFPVRSSKDPSTIAYRSVWRRQDDGSLEVARERPADAGWRREFAVKYRREAPAK